MAARRTATNVAAVLAIVSAMAMAASAKSDGVISVTGEGRVAVEPDLATVSVGVSTQNETASGALDENNAKMAAVFDAIDALGIDPDDVQTSRLDLSPRYDSIQQPDGSFSQQIVGFRASNTVTIKVRDIDAVGDVLGVLVDSGATDVNGISFSVEDAVEEHDLARTRAVEDAQRIAQTYANAASYSIKGVSKMNDFGGSQPQFRMASEAAYSAAPSSVPVASGSLFVTASIAIDFVIEYDKDLAESNE